MTDQQRAQYEWDQFIMWLEMLGEPKSSPEELKERKPDYNNMGGFINEWDDKYIVRLYLEKLKESWRHNSDCLNRIIQGRLVLLKNMKEQFPGFVPEDHQRLTVKKKNDDYKYYCKLQMKKLDQVIKRTKYKLEKTR